MDNTLLTTKLHIPLPSRTLVHRPRLITSLSRALTCSLTLVSAPAGYGKTTLVSNWLRETGVPAAWLSLDEGDNDPVRFLQYFLAAVHNIVPAIQPDLFGARQGSQPIPYDALLNITLNEIAGRSAPSVLVLDDFHAIQAQPILDMLAFLVEHAPPQMHLALLSRTDPPLPLSRWRARNQLVEIRAEQLRFTDEEMAVFLNEMMGLRLSGDDTRALGARTEGWIAGLQLASIAMQATASESFNSMRGGDDLHSFVSAFTGSHYYIIDYLTEEVLKSQPEKVRSFLLQTSILTRMCGPLCDEVVGTLEHSNVETFQRSNEILEYLERANLFLIPLDDKRQWYRYHHLFADVLNLRLAGQFPQQLPELHRRASQWYEKNAMIPEAIQHALMAGDQARAAHLVEQHGCSLLMRGEGYTLLKWVNEVESYSQTHPWLAILKAWALALTGDLEPVEPTLQAAEGLIASFKPSLEVKIMMGSMAAVRAYLANLQGEAHLAADYAEGALEYLPDSNAFSCSLRSVATSILGDARWMNGNLDQAERAYLEAAQISQAAGNIYMAMIANANLADVWVELGKLHQAARLYSETLQIATRPDGQKLPLADRLYAGLGKIAYEWNQLEAAAQYAHQCIELSQQWENSNVLAKGYILLARLERATCNHEQAQAALRAAERLASERRLSPRLSETIKITAARWWLDQGNPERASRLNQQLGIGSESLTEKTGIQTSQESEYLLLLRLLLARGEHEAALCLSERLFHRAQATKRKGRVIEILALQALAFQGKKDMARALEVLEMALSLAQPEGYARVLLDEGEAMAKLLYQARAHRMGGEYASELLSAPGGVSAPRLPAAQALIEPLTRRELDVLNLIEAGLSNQEIARKLVISIPTVKRHISNIYAKLGVKSRTQAVSQGKELNLFQQTVDQKSIH